MQGGGRMGEVGGVGMGGVECSWMGMGRVDRDSGCRSGGWVGFRVGLQCKDG